MGEKIDSRPDVLGQHDEVVAELFIQQLPETEMCCPYLYLG